MPQVLVCDGDLTTRGNGDIRCSTGAYTVDIQSADSGNLAEFLDSTFTFDQYVFGLVVSSLLVAFITGQALGVVHRRLSVASR